MNGFFIRDKYKMNLVIKNKFRTKWFAQLAVEMHEIEFFLISGSIFLSSVRKENICGKPVS